jgi:hypothetical protein
MIDMDKDRDTLLLTGGILIGLLLRFSAEEWEHGAAVAELHETYKDHFRQIAELRRRIS